MTTRSTHAPVKEFFLYLGSAIALYASAVSLLDLLFDTINARFPDVLDYGFDPYSSSLRLAIATLVILFPLYLILMRVLKHNGPAHPEESHTGVRKWLTYLTLFLAGVAIVVDLVVLINTFLGGEITARFIWKVLSVLVVAGGIFSYYFYDLKDFWRSHRMHSRITTWVATLFVIASIISAFAVVGTPATQRLLRIDSQKVGDLQSIQWQIINYWQQKGKLPEGLDALNDPIAGFLVPHDPETNLGKMYTYAVTEKDVFEICADFNLPTPKTGTPLKGDVAEPFVGSMSYPSMRGVDNWEHDSGVYCYKRTIDPELYPVVKK